MEYTIAADWIPENPLGVKFPIGNIYPLPDFGLFGGRDEDGTLAESETVKAGLYGWIVYGVLIFAHWSYFADRYYWEYSMSNQNLHLAWRTWYGLGVWLRDFTKTVTWGVAGLAWCISLIPVPITFIYFAQIATYLLMTETFIVFIGALIKILSSFAGSDLWENDHMNYTPWSKLNHAFG